MLAVKHNTDYRQVHLYLMGNKNAGHTLYAEAYPVVKAFVWNRASGLQEQDKEDILADAMVASKEKLERYNGTCTFSTFVIGFAKHKIQEKYKAEKRQVAIAERIIPLTPVTNEYDDPLQILIEKELREAVAQAQLMLSDEHRQVMMLRMNGMTAKQIAEMFGFTVDAVNSMYYRSIKAFKNNFEKIYNGRDDFSPFLPLTDWR
jgi:RNA polymerase sigma factor (sigma-70 family)